MSLAPMSLQANGGEPSAVPGARINPTDGAPAASALFKGKKGAFKRILSGLLLARRPEAPSTTAEKGITRAADGAKGLLRSRKGQAALLPPHEEGSRAAFISKGDEPATKGRSALAGVSAEGARKADERGPRKAAKREESGREEGAGREEAIAALLLRNAKRGPEEAVQKAEAKDAKGKARKEAKGFHIDVRDLRTEAAVRKGASAERNLADLPRANERDMVIDLPAPKDAKDARTAKAMGSTEVSFSNRLAQALQDTYNGELVKNAQIILRDGDSGIIRLSLRPESLGSVKVALDLADNKVIGKIVVESEAAREAFERNLDGLTRSFVDSGFDGAKLEVAVDGRSSSGAEAGFAWAGGGGDRESSEGAGAAAARYEATAASGALDLLA